MHIEQKNVAEIGITKTERKRLKERDKDDEKGIIDEKDERKRKERKKNEKEKMKRKKESLRE